MDQTNPSPLLDVTRRHLAMLTDAYTRHTGARDYAVGKIVRSDAKWAQSFRTLNFRVGSYDAAVQAFSAVWPDDLPWPESVPRQAPARLSEDQSAALRAYVDASHWPRRMHQLEEANHG